jgi:uncharacterized protein YdiU (UPF0061 family)
MNTDNMAISGETIDYGPCAFMDAYDPATVFSSIDRQGRYAYGNQPTIAAWNLARFAKAILPLLHDDEEQAIKLAEDTIADFSGMFEGYWLKGMRAKLGILNEETQDKSVIKDLLDLMQRHRADYTNTFRALTFDKPEDTELFDTMEFADWYVQWKERLGRQEESKAVSQELMRKSNPAVIPRNHRVEEALDAAVNEGDYGVMDRLLNVLLTPYAHTPEQNEFASQHGPSSRPYRTFCGT